jgi:hypothetical protein
MNKDFTIQQPVGHIGRKLVIVATVVTALGLFLVGAITQLYGYRLGGTIAIPVLAVYTLKNVIMLPIFVLSTLLAFIGLWVVKQKTLIYGRDELLATMAIGSAIPLGILLFFDIFTVGVFRSVVFIGSVLPGLAAYNYHQVKPQYRLKDAGMATALFFGLFTLGWFLITPELAPILGTVTPPALYTETSDIAVLKNAVVTSYLDPTILPRINTVALFLFGLLTAERARGRYGVRIGLISLPLLAIYALASRWLVVLYVLLLVIGFVYLELVHYITLLYGRVLISLTTGVTLLIAIPFVIYLPVVRGLSAYFAAILAGINAYNIHTSPESKRPLFVPLQAGIFTMMLLLARATGGVRPRGFPQAFELPQVVAGVLLVLICLAIVEYKTVDLPTPDDVFAASILSGEDE